MVPALGGSERKISSFGYHPRWSPDGTKILFDTQVLSLANLPTLYLMSLDGDAPHEILSGFFKDFVTLRGGYVAWHPDGQRISIWATHRQLGPGLWTLPPGGGTAVKSAMRPEVSQRLKEAAVIPGRFAWVTDFQSPARMATPANQASEIGVSAKRLVLPITEVSGSLWVLENVER